MALLLQCIAGVDLYFRHESELPISCVCCTQDLNTGCPVQGRLLTTTPEIDYTNSAGVMLTGLSWVWGCGGGGLTDQIFY